MGRIERWHWISRENVRGNPDRVFVFGDNLERRGLAGQAKAMRGEPNTIGVATKRAPGMKPDDFFSDQPDEFEAVSADFMQVVVAFKTGKVIVIPKNGLGSGLSQLRTRSPRIHQLLNQFIVDLEGRHG